MCRATLVQQGFTECPTWHQVVDGVRPEQVFEAEPGEWNHGWQYYAASRIEQNHRESVILPAMSPASQAMLRSQSGPNSASHLTAVPSCAELTIEPWAMRTLLLRRLRLPLGLAERRYNGARCGAALDSLGDHRAACRLSGRLRRRATPMERMLARICREGGARVRTNQLVRNLNFFLST